MQQRWKGIFERLPKRILIMYAYKIPMNHTNITDLNLPMAQSKSHKIIAPSGLCSYNKKAINIHISNNEID